MLEGAVLATAMLCVHVQPIENAAALTRVLAGREVGEVVLFEIADGWITQGIPAAWVCDYRYEIVITPGDREDAETTVISCIYAGMRETKGAER